MCADFERRAATGSVGGQDGAVAQLVERLRGTQKVARSSRVSSTLRGFSTTESEMGSALAGMVAGEGCFHIARRSLTFSDGSPRLRFVFSVSMASRDRPLLEALQCFLGCGCLNDAPPRQAHWQPTSTLCIASNKAHRAATIPFAEQFLFPSAKRQQFEHWRDALYAYERDRPSRYGRGPSACTEEGCERPVRGRGLCRSHYYRVTGY